MILRTDHRPDGLAIREAEQRSLLARHEFLYDDAAAGGTELLILHDVIDGCQRLSLGLRHDDTLASCETIGLHDDRRALLFYVVTRCLRLREHCILCRRDAVLLHEVLRERFRALDLGCQLRRAESLYASGIQRIDDTVRERYLRADDNEVDGFLLGQLYDCIIICDVDSGNAFRYCRHSRIARHRI